jgi:hypothetical protein
VRTIADQLARRSVASRIALGDEMRCALPPLRRAARTIRNRLIPRRILATIGAPSDSPKDVGHA